MVASNADIYILWAHHAPPPLPRGGGGDGLCDKEWIAWQAVRTPALEAVWVAVFNTLVLVLRQSPQNHFDRFKFNCYITLDLSVRSKVCISKSILLKTFNYCLSLPCTNAFNFHMSFTFFFLIFARYLKCAKIKRVKSYFYSGSLVFFLSSVTDSSNIRTPFPKKILPAYCAQFSWTLNFMKTKGISYISFSTECKLVRYSSSLQLTV